MNLFKIVRTALGYSDQNNDNKLTSKQIWELERMNHSTQKQNVNNALYNNVGESEKLFSNWESEISKKSVNNKIIVGNCEYCGSGYFNNEKNCTACGSPIKISKKEEIKNSENKSKNIPKKYMCSVANVSSYNEEDDLFFTGVSLLSSLIEIKEVNKINRSLQYVYYHSEPEPINIHDVEWKTNNNLPKVMKLVLEIQIVSVDEYNIIETIQYIIPRARVTKINNVNLSAIPLAVRYNNVGDIYGYIDYS